MVKVKHDNMAFSVRWGGRTRDGNEGLKHGGDECGGEGKANNET